MQLLIVPVVILLLLLLAIEVVKAVGKKLPLIACVVLVCVLFWYVDKASADQAPWHLAILRGTTLSVRYPGYPSLETCEAALLTDGPHDLELLGGDYAFCFAEGKTT